MRQPILVPNANCLPDPSLFHNTQAEVTLSHDYNTFGTINAGRYFCEYLGPPPRDRNTDPYTAVTSGGPVVITPDWDSIYSVYDDEGAEWGAYIMPVIAIDLSTNGIYLLVNGIWWGPVPIVGMTMQEAIEYTMSQFPLFPYVTPRADFKL